MQRNQPQLFSTVNLSFGLVGSINEIILQDSFTLEQNDWNEGNAVILSLTNNFLCLVRYLDGSRVNRLEELCFDFKFELGRQNKKVNGQNGQEKRILGNPFCLKFEKIGYKPLCIYSDKIDILLKWKNELQKKINRKGFHDLFRPIKKIGKGNFASVYLAERLEDNKMVAVKAFSKQGTFSQQKGKQSLLNQINIMRKFNQQNVLKLYAVFQSDNSIYMTMELLEGGQLFNKIQSKHKFTEQETKQVMKGLLRGLQHMHSKRIMHRDLKPQNIMLRQKQSYEVVIVDFGLATWADEQSYLFVRCGTPGYVAPQIINIRDLSTKSDPICDIFSAGLIFHILLMGRTIFPGRTYNQVLSQNRACDFNLQHQDYCKINPQAHSLLIKMLDKNPRTRISATQALHHSYFSQMQIQQQPLHPIQIANITKQRSDKQQYPKPRLINKMSLNSEQPCRKFLRSSVRSKCASLHRKSSHVKENIY